MNEQVLNYLNTNLEQKLSDLIDEISEYEVTEESFKKSCCTTWDLCPHTVTMKIPQSLWTELKSLLLK